MAPPSATEVYPAQRKDADQADGNKQSAMPGTAQKPGSEASWTLMSGSSTGPPRFDDKYEEREYQKGRLALAFRIFSQHGFDRGVAGHITLRVCSQKPPPWIRYNFELRDFLNMCCPYKVSFADNRRPKNGFSIQN